MFKIQQRCRRPLLRREWQISRAKPSYGCGGGYCSAWDQTHKRRAYPVLISRQLANPHAWMRMPVLCAIFWIRATNTLRSGNVPAVIGTVECLESLPGYHVPTTASNSQTPCSSGTYQPSTGRSECEDSMPYVNSSAAFRKTTSAGTYQPDYGQLGCIVASPGNYVPVPASSVQTQCEPGVFKASGQTICSQAQLDYYVSEYGAEGSVACP